MIDTGFKVYQSPDFSICSPTDTLCLFMVHFLQLVQIMFKKVFNSSQGVISFHRMAIASSMVSTSSTLHLLSVVSKLFFFAHSKASALSSVFSKQCRRVTQVNMVFVHRGRIPGTLSCSAWYVDIKRL